MIKLIISILKKACILESYQALELDLDLSFLNLT